MWPRLPSKKKLRRFLVKKFAPKAAPGVKLTCEVSPGGTLSRVKTIPPSAAKYGAILRPWVKFHFQITGRMLPPHTASLGGKTGYIGSTSKSHSKFPRKSQGRWSCV